MFIRPVPTTIVNHVGGVRAESSNIGRWSATIMPASWEKNTDCQIRRYVYIHIYTPIYAYICLYTCACAHLNTLLALFYGFRQITVDTLCLHNNTTKNGTHRCPSMYFLKVVPAIENRLAPGPVLVQTTNKLNTPSCNSLYFKIAGRQARHLRVPKPSCQYVFQDCWSSV